MTAPTGSGKTLAAFLWALDRLIVGHWAVGRTRILYVSPLKALNNDIRRNLTRPLVELKACFTGQGEPFPNIRMATRSGDTPPGERREMIRRPPDILITTPESLHLLLASGGGRSILGDVRTVILDEIHAVAGNKRGSLLMAAVDRLVPLCGEFQRIVLSATVRPVEAVSAFVGGFEMSGDPADPIYRPRKVACCQVAASPSMVHNVLLPRALSDMGGNGSLWDELAETFRATILRHRATIVFTNSRRLCEKLTYLINAGLPDPIAYAHHGSLSKALRLEVEAALKKGALKAIVATSSLELGIDIGTLDQVILVQTPPSVASAMQRIGRSGHAVGAASRAMFVPTHAVDGIASAVIAHAAVQGDIEPLHPVDGPLDVLAQVLVAMVGVDVWDLTALYNAVRTSWPFHRLTRPVFDLVVEMLAGRYAATRIPQLAPKVIIDRLENTICAAKGALLQLYASGGVIPDRGYYTLRNERTGARIGELDEEFVWEAKKGQVFTLGTQNWRIRRITDSDVLVRPARPKASAPPFWRAEAMDQDNHLAGRIGRFLEAADADPSQEALKTRLCTSYHVDDAGARYLADFLERQRQRTGCRLPHRHHLVVEIIPQIKGAKGAGQIVIHTFWGGRLNRPFALALSAAWSRRYGHVPAVFPTNEAVHLILPDDVKVTDDILALVPADGVDALVRDQLEGAGGFGARFRECAGRALLLPGRGFKRRRPLWLTRKNAQHLMDAVARFDDFPILLETWRSCLNDDFDMPALARRIREIESGKTAVSVVRVGSPSPMALAGAWRQVNQYMYEDDRQPGSVKSELSPDLLQQVLFTPELRPAVPDDGVADFVEKRQRLYPGYAPASAAQLVAWVRERLLIPLDEWLQLKDRIAMQGETRSERWGNQLTEKVLRLVPPGVEGADRSLIVAAENAPMVAAALYGGTGRCRWLDLKGDRFGGIDELVKRMKHHPTPDGAAMLSQWLRYYGPLGADRIQKRLGLAKSLVQHLLADLVESRVVVSGRLIEGEHAVRFCDADNFETLLRMVRRRGRMAVEPRPVADLAPLLARHQRIIGTAAKEATLEGCLSRLACLGVPAALWETEIFPARLSVYDPDELDRMLQTAGLMWIGGPGRQLTFCHEADLDLIQADTKAADAAAETGDQDRAGESAVRRFTDRRGRYTLADLMTGAEPSQAVLDMLWTAAWSGRVTNDTMVALRRRLAKKSTPQQSLPAPGTRGRFGSRRQRRRAALGGFTGPIGTWRIVTEAPAPDGLIAAEELAKERVRLLLDRYGILFRQLLTREHPAFQWHSIFRTLRLMELAGEVVEGLFFDGLPGPQFADPQFVEAMGKVDHDETVFWICAQDPICLCGLGVPELAGDLPRRVAGTHLVYRGCRLFLVSMGWGRRVSIRTAPDDTVLPDCLGVFEHLLARRIEPKRRITIETINDVPAPQSPFLDIFRKRFDTLEETHSVTLYARRGR